MSAEALSTLRVSPFMDAAECAIYIRMTKPNSVQTIYRWAKMGKIPVRKLNGILRFHRDDIDNWSASNNPVPTTPSLSRFDQAKLRLLEGSLKTEYTADRLPRTQKGTG